MIIQCEKCQTKFRLDDSRVTDKGVKVRCTKCKHVFRVQWEGLGAESSQETGALDGFPSAAAQAEDSSVSSENQDFAAESVPDSPFDSKSLEDAPFHSDSADFSSAVSEPALVALQKETAQGLDFSDDAIFGDVAPPTPKASSKTISFDFEDDAFAESMYMGGQDSSGKSLSPDAPGDAPFNLGEIDFGDELTSVVVQQVNPDDLKPSQEILFAPLAKAQDKTADENLTQSFLGEKLADTEQQELPPLSIVSRRKQSPFTGGLIAVVAVLLISLLGYLGYSSFSTPKDALNQENGKIAVRAVTASFVVNTAAGELLVISGEALNEYPKPRASLQVKVTVFDTAGQSIATKSAYGGNPLTEDQLKSLPLDKIEAAMANQFGDSLGNMEVAPGKAIPFVVVLANLPKGAKDFAVQSTGSTAATGKQQ